MEIAQPFLPLDDRFKNREGGFHVPRQLPLALSSPAPFSVDNYIVTEANRRAFEMLEAWPDWPSPVTILIGGEKSGKSHLASVWAAQAYAKQCDITNLEKAAELAAQGIPVLLEDADRQSFNETLLFHLINAVKEAYSTGKPSALLITAQRRPAAWGLHLADLASRLGAANLAEIDEADDALRQAILAKSFADRQLLVDTDILRFILTRGERSPAKLTEMVDLLDNLALERKGKITRSLAAEALSLLAAREADDNEAR